MTYPLIEEYQDLLKKYIYCKLLDSSSNFPRIVNRTDFHNPLPMHWLVEDYKSFLKENGEEVPRNKKLPTFNYLAQSLPVITGSCFMPNAGAIHRPYKSRHKYLNTFRKFEAKHNPIELNPLFLEFLKEFIKNDYERHIFCQYIAHAIQFPEQRPSWHLMLMSETGTGKGWLFEEVLTPLLIHTQSVSSFSKLTDKFSPILEGTMLLLLDDCKAKTESTQTQLKSMLSEERVYSEPKGKQGRMVNTYTRMILASNEEVPLYIDSTERRWFVFERLGYSNGLVDKEGRDDRVDRFIEPLSAWLELDGAIEAVYNFFANYSLEGFDHKKCPETQSMRDLAARSESQELQLTRQILELHPFKYITVKELQAEFDSAGLSRPSNNHIPHLFEGCGWTSSRPMIKGEKHGTVWHPKSLPRDELIAALSNPRF